MKSHSTLIVITAAAILLTACAGAGRHNYKVLRSSHDEPIPRIGLQETETEWVVEGEALQGASHELTVKQAEADAYGVLAIAFGTWVRTGLIQDIEGSNLPGEAVEEFIQRAQEVFAENIVLGAKRRTVYWEYVSEQMPNRRVKVYYNARVHVAISTEDRIASMEASLQKMTEQYSQERNERLRQSAIRLLDRLRSESRIPPGL